jgi:uncharacterized protein (DUF1778 family)
MRKLQSQISAYVSERTRELVERYAERHGIKKGHLVEEALLYHLQALRELPADVLIPARVVVDEKNALALGDRLDKPRPPTEAMKELFSKD